MASKFENNVDIKGYVYNHTLAVKVSKKGVTYIGGAINVATDNDGMNVVSVNYMYEPESRTNRDGVTKANANFEVLKDIIENGKTYENVGLEGHPTKVRIACNIETNDFVASDGTIAEPKRIRGGFIHIENGDIEKIGCSSFKADMLIESYNEVEREGEDNYGRIKGWVFNFREEFIPVEFSVHTDGGMRYFDNADISKSNPMLTKVWGDIVCSTVEHKTETESAFGAPIVKITTRTLRDWAISGAAVEPYEFGSEEDKLDALRVTAGKKARAEHLEQVMADYKAYQASRGNAISETVPFDEDTKSQSPTASVDFRF